MSAAGGYQGMPGRRVEDTARSGMPGRPVPGPYNDADRPPLPPTSDTGLISGSGMPGRRASNNQQSVTPADLAAPMPMPRPSRGAPPNGLPPNGLPPIRTSNSGYVSGDGRRMSANGDARSSADGTRISADGTRYSTDGDVKLAFPIKTPKMPAVNDGNGVEPSEEDFLPENQTPGKEYRAGAVMEADEEKAQLPPDPKGPQSLLGYPFVRQRAINWVGWLLFLFYLGALGFYLWVRITKTLGLGKLYTWYGITLLVVECMGASTVIIYGTNLLFNPVHEVPEDNPLKPGTPKVRLPYHIRVVVACYKEDLECIMRTVRAAHAATLPYGCRRTIYLCDDGKDPEKRKWIMSKGPEFVYVSGRVRAKGEMNGKSGNVNNLCSQLYPPGLPIPGNEVLCVFDADQMAKKDFFLKTVPLLDGGDDVAMVLSPQCFHNMNLHTDIFNHSNIHFWEYMQPGYDAIGFISCTGTNFLIRANAFQKAGWSPTYTLTEDYALGMELKKEKLHCRYVQEYLALGEAPDQVRNCFQQRSRWTKGHFQIMFNPRVCPLLQSKLSLPMRILYCSGVWAYVVGGIATPYLIAVPLITIWIGVFPLVISHWASLGMSIYGAANYLLLYYVRSPWHLESLWFANVANQLLWWAYWKAAWRSLYTRLCFCCAAMTFKATAKGKGKLKQTVLGDIWIHIVTFTLLSISIGVGIWQLIAGANIISPLLISVLWASYAAIPPFLLLWYTFFGHGIIFQILCKLCMIASFGCAGAAIGLMWAIHNYNSKEFSGGQIANKDIGVLFRYIHNGFNQLG